MTKKENAILVTMIIVSAIILAWFVNSVNTRIDRRGIVTNIEGQVVEITDNGGTIWAWECEEGEEFTKGEHVILVMNNNKTEETEEDDIIVKIKVDKLFEK